MAKKDILRARIKKQTFGFNIKKRFENLKRYSIKRRPSDVSLDIFKESREATAVFGSTLIGSPFFQYFLIVVVAFLILLAGFIFISNPTNPPMALPVEEQFSELEGLEVNDAGLLTYGSFPDRKGSPADYSFFISLGYSGGYENLNGTIDVFDDVDSSDIYFLDFSGDVRETNSFSTFRSKLEDKLIDKGYNFNLINVEDVSDLPEKSILIVSSGYAPCGWLSGDYTLFDILEKEVVVLYIGEDFEQCLDDRTGQLRPASNTLGFIFTRSAMAPKGLNMVDARYKVVYPQYSSSLIYDSITSMNIGGSYMLFFPTFIDEGWSSPDLLVKDICKVVGDSSWHTPKTTTSFTLPKDNENYIFSSYFSGPDKFVKVKLSGSNEESISNKVLVFDAEYVDEGGAFIYSSEKNPLVYPPQMSGDYPRITFAFGKEAEEGFSPYYEVVKDGTVIYSGNVGFITETSKSANFDLMYNFKPGSYLIKIYEGSETLALGHLKVVGPAVSLDGGRSRDTLDLYVFAVLDEYGQEFDFGRVTVYLDEELVEKKGAVSSIFDYSMLEDQPYIYLDLTSLEPGEHIFTFDFGNGITYDYELTKRASGPDIFKIEYLIMLGIAVAIVYVANRLRRPDRQTFYVDIPDFPPISKIKVPVKKDTVLELFERVNRDYSWQYTPLILGEVKNAFRKITYRGKSVVVGEYNLQRIMDRLIVQGLIAEYSGYYGLKKWLDASGKSMQYLSIFRKLRDIFVNNAVKFTNLGKSDEFDTKINIQGEDMFVHIYGDPEAINRVLRTVALGTTVIVFEDKQKLDFFKDRLYSPNKDVVRFMLEYKAGSIKLFTIKELEDYIKQIKG